MHLQCRQNTGTVKLLEMRRSWLRKRRRDPLKRVMSKNNTFCWEGQKIKSKDVRKCINNELTLMKERGEKVVKVSDIAFKFNHTRVGVGKILGERAEVVGDIHRTRTTRSYQTAEWEFI
jgi:hypothetical protein